MGMKMKVILTFFAGLLALALLGGIVFYVGWVNFVDNYEIGYEFNASTGKVDMLNHTGYVVTPPWVLVDVIDTRPIQLCMNANKRVLNCKLVKFNPAGFQQLIAWHGRGDYKGHGNGGNSTEGQSGDTVFEQILKSYAFSDKPLPSFMTIIQQ